MEHLAETTHNFPNYLPIVSLKGKLKAAMKATHIPVLTLPQQTHATVEGVSSLSTQTFLSAFTPIPETGSLRYPSLSEHQLTIQDLNASTLNDFIFSLSCLWRSAEALLQQSNHPLRPGISRYLPLKASGNTWTLGLHSNKRSVFEQARVDYKYAPKPAPPPDEITAFDIQHDFGSFITILGDPRQPEEPSWIECGWMTASVRLSLGITIESTTPCKAPELWTDGYSFDFIGEQAVESLQRSLCDYYFPGGALAELIHKHNQTMQRHNGPYFGLDAGRSQRARSSPSFSVHLPTQLNAAQLVPLESPLYELLWRSAREFILQ